MFLMLKYNYSYHPVIFKFTILQKNRGEKVKHITVFSIKIPNYSYLLAFLNIKICFSG